MNEINATFDPPNNHKPYWLTLGTIIWSIVIFGVFSIAQMVGLFASGIDTANGAPAPEDMAEILQGLINDGDALTWATFAGFAVAVPLMLLVIKLKKGSKIADYLALNRNPDWRTYLKWIAIMAVVVVGMGLIGQTMDEKSADTFVRGVVESASSMPMLFLAVAILAPAFEELFFRGFMYKGLAEGKLGPVGAIVLTAALWAIIHAQYDWFPILTIFLMGLVLGFARYKTGSIWVPIVLHSLNNGASLVAMIFSGDATPP